MAQSKIQILLVSCGVSLAVLGAAVAWGETRSGEAVNANGQAISTSNAPTSFAPLVAKVSPAVVSIDIEGHAKARDVTLSQQGGQPPPQFFFGSPFGLGPQAGPQGRNRRDGAPLPKFHAAGSGFFISRDGYIVTNNHVVEDGEKITVHMADGQSLKAHLVGRDPATDIAVIKVDGGPFPFVDFENAGRPRVGDWVVAVGNPFGLDGTATAGIVSALGREDVADSPLLDYMQIDAPINRGNSGGPTFDTNGRVVGVNTAIFSPSGGSVGIGFDIPASVASSISQQLIAQGHVRHGYLGATVQQISPDLAESLGVETRAGAIVDAVTPASPAEQAGLRGGDVLTAINGVPVHSPHQITRLVAFSQPGARLELTVLRHGHTQTLEARAGVRPSEQTLARAVQSEENDGEDNGGG